MKLLSLVLAALAPNTLFAGNLSAVLNNPDIVVIERGINYVANESNYNIEKPLFTEGGKTQKVWSRESGGYFMSVESSGTAVSRISEIYRKDASDAYVARKTLMNSDGSIKVLTECESSKTLGLPSAVGLHDLQCVSATESLCKQVHQVYPSSEALDKELAACDKLSANLKKIEGIYNKEIATKKHQDIFAAEADSLKADFANLAGTLKFLPSLNQKKYNISQEAVTDIKSAGGTFGRLAKLCNTKQSIEKPSWYSKSAKGGGSGSTSSQRGQR